MWGPDIFHSGPQKPFSPKWRENRGENVETCYVTKIPSHFLPCPHYIPHSIELIYCFLLILFRMTFKKNFFFFWSSFVYLPCPHYWPVYVTMVMWIIFFFLKMSSQLTHNQFLLPINFKLYIIIKKNNINLYVFVLIFILFNECKYIYFLYII